MRCSRVFYRVQPMQHDTIVLILCVGDTMTLVHAIIIAILQGISELFPVSSLGHAVLLPKLLHWGIDQKAES